jgi:small-conductance mechanosensitive channel
MTLSAVAARAPGLAEPLAWLLAAALVAAVVGTWRLRRALGLNRRLTPRVRSAVSASLNAGTVALVIVVVAWFLWQRAPLLLGISLAALAAAAGLGVGLRGRAWIWGLAAIWRGRIKISDRLRFDSIDGTVVEVGIFGVKVVTDEGAQVFIPTAKLAGDPFEVASPEQVHPAEITVRSADGELTDDDVEILRRIATLSPYRQSGSLVAIQLAGDRRSATVEFRCWSEGGARLASAQVQRAFAAARAAPDAARDP